MKKVLYIKANAKPNELSRTFKISDNFIKYYQENNPNDEIITLDLYQENINFLTFDDINNLFAPKNETSKNHPVLKYAYQFADADKYIISAPMWNLSIPAILKAYIDYICVTGITFKYTENGPVGLCQNKKAVIITTTGGEYSVEPGASFEIGTRYLKTLLNFFGITDITTITAEKLDIIGEDVEEIMKEAIKTAEEVAKEF